MRDRINYHAAQTRQRVRDAVLAKPRDCWQVREDLARRHLRGDGIEIGAAMFPMRIPFADRVRYVDYQSKADMIASEPEFIAAGGKPLELIPEVDVVDNAATLAKFTDRTLDFVVANHVLEHVEDPIAALGNLLRVLRPGGILMITLPDPRYSFDNPRERTTVEHLLRDHAEGPEVSRRDHYAEWARFVEGRHGEDLQRRCDEYAAEDAHHHFHVWELPTFMALLAAIDLHGEVVEGVATEPEFSVILRRT